MPRYEDYGTYIDTNGLISGVAGDIINESLSKWLSGAKDQIILNNLDSEFAQKGYKSFKFLVEKGVAGEIIGSALEAVEVRIDAQGDISLAFNLTSISVGNILVDSGAELLITAGLVAIIPGSGVLYTFGIAIAAGVIWDAFTDEIGDIFDIAAGTEDVYLRLFNTDGNHIASAVYPEGIGYKEVGFDGAIKYLISNTSFDLQNTTIKIEGGIDGKQEFRIGAQPYNLIAEQLGVSVDTLFTIANTETDNSRYIAKNANGQSIYFYASDGKFPFLVPVEINGALELILVRDIYLYSVSSANSIAGFKQGTFFDTNLVLGNNNGGNITGGSSADLLLGGMGSDIINGNGGSDTILGQGGNDTIIASEGEGEILDGGVGIDLVDYSQIPTTFDYDVNINLLINAVNIDFAGPDDDDQTIFSVEDVFTGAGNDTIIGDSYANKLFANAGNDNIFAAGGNDTLIGGKGNDTLEGGLGNDTYIFKDTYENDTIIGGTGNIDKNDKITIDGTIFKGDAKQILA